MKKFKKNIAIFLSCLILITSNSILVLANSFNSNETLWILEKSENESLIPDENELKSEIDKNIAKKNELFEDNDVSNASSANSQLEDNCDIVETNEESKFDNQNEEKEESNLLLDENEFEFENELDEVDEKEEIENVLDEEPIEVEVDEETELELEESIDTYDEVDTNSEEVEDVENSNVKNLSEEDIIEDFKDNSIDRDVIESEIDKEDIELVSDKNDELLNCDVKENEETIISESDDLDNDDNKLENMNLQFDDECKSDIKDELNETPDEIVEQVDIVKNIEEINKVDTKVQNKLEDNIIEDLVITNDEEKEQLSFVVNADNENINTELNINNIENLNETKEIENNESETNNILEINNDKVLFGINGDFMNTEKSVNKIVITNNRPIYYIGDTLDIIVTANYSDETTRELEKTEYIVSGYNNEVVSDEMTVVVSYTYNSNTVNENFTSKMLAKPDGSGTDADPYLLTSMTDMNYIVNEVASGVTFENIYFKATNDINFDTTWQGIGSVTGGNDYSTNYGKYVLHFAGIIDGDNHTFTFESGCSPLLNYARYTTVKNLIIDAPYMDGFALVANHGIDYWPSGKSSTTVDKTITIMNVNIKSGSRFKNGGYIGSFQNVYGNGVAGKNIVEIKDCKVDSNVLFGVDINGNSNNQDKVGSFVGVACAHIENCESHAKVYGKNYVGGIAGYPGNSMTDFYVKNSKFYGELNASENCVGGIIGGGFYATGMAAAPNANPLSVTNCYVDETVTINGNNYIGGIIGAEEGIKQAWDNKGFSAPVKNNYSLATINARENDAYIGGIIGYMASLDKVNDIQNNYYKADDDSVMPIGHIDKVWTTYTNPKVVIGTEYGEITGSHSSCNRTDDPLGTDCYRIGRRATQEEIDNGTILALLGKVVVNVLGSGKADFKDIKGYIYEKEIDENTKVWDVVKETLDKNSYTYMGDGSYLMSMSDNKGHTLSGGDINFGAWSGILYEVNGEQPIDTMSDKSVAIGDNIVLFFSYAETLTLSGNYKKSYTINSKFSTQNMVAQVLYYKNLWPQDIPDGYGTTIDALSFSGFNSSKAGKQNITASYGGVSTTFVITIESNKKSSSSGGGGGGGGGNSSLQGNKTNGLNSVMYSKSNAKNVVVEKSSLLLNSLLGSWKKDMEGDWTFAIDKTNDSVVAKQGIYTMASVDEETGLVLNDCYYFNENGKMQIGWIKNDLDNSYYYFETIKNNDMGKMARGWKKIGETWYWFDANGKMLVNSTTPDGYSVNSEGEWFDAKNATNQTNIEKDIEVKHDENLEKKGPAAGKL